MHSIELEPMLSESLPGIRLRDDVHDRIASLRTKARFDITSRIAHGIRTPLTSILGFTELLSQSTAISEADRDEFHRIIHAETSRLTRFMMTLHDWIDLDEGRLHLRLTASDIAETVRRAIEASKFEAASRSVRLLNTVSPEPLCLLADHERVRVAVEQVILNALQATSRQGRVVVQLYRTAEAAIITVADTGVGIPSSDLSKVTRPFYRVDRQDGGESRLGLGLAVARGIAELHGGSLLVASRERQGTMVTIRLAAASDASFANA
jgi:two-component system cell cycle sensor histidine kinase PleC